MRKDEIGGLVTVDNNPSRYLLVEQNDHLHSPEEPMSLNITTNDPAGGAEQVSVRLYRYNRSGRNYHLVTLTDVLPSAAETCGTGQWNACIASKAPKGTYRLEFKYYDKTECWDFIIK